MEAAIQAFFQDYMAAKRLKKYHQLVNYTMEVLSNKKSPCYTEIIEYDEDTIEQFVCNECTQIVISMCVKSLSRDRAEELCAKLFPRNNTQNILDESYSEGNVPSEHVVYGYDMMAKDIIVHMEAMKRFTFTDEDVKNLLNELSLPELANIVPDIAYITYKYVPL